MTATIKYAYLKQQTWIFRRNYPRDLQNLFGTQALKQSLKTGDVKLAKSRAAEINAKFEEIVTKGRQGIVDLPEKQRRAVRVTPVSFPAVNPLIGRSTVAELARTYLNKRSGELRHGGFKSVRFSVGLFASAYGPRQVGSLSREDGKAFLRLIAQLSPHVRKTEKTRGWSSWWLTLLVVPTGSHRKHRSGSCRRSPIFSTGRSMRVNWLICLSSPFGWIRRLRWNHTRLQLTWRWASCWGLRTRELGG